MGLSRRNVRFQSAIWPGFVDAMTGLLLVLMFVLMIFMLVQSVLRETITGQESQLSRLSDEVSGLKVTLNLQKEELSQAQQELQIALKDLVASQGEIEALAIERDESKSLLAIATAQISQLELDVSQAQEAEADLLAKLAAASAEFDAAQAELSALEKQRLAEQAAALILQERLEGATAELSTLSLALEAKRKEAEETLTLLAAARAAKEQGALDLAKAQADALLSEEQALDARAKLEVLLAEARQTLAQKESLSEEQARQTEALNQQVAALRSQVQDLQALLSLAGEAEIAAEVKVQDLGEQLNLALAQVASEERKRRALEEAERLRLEEEAKRLANKARDLEQFRSDFFGELRKVLEGQERVKIQGDRFVFSSEVLFNTGRADLSDSGRAEISNIASILKDIAEDIPSEIDWIIRVDGHTDNIPVSGNGAFRNNWELSQARALSVVEYMIDELGLPPERLSANGFGEYRPLVSGQTEAARAANRRIELKLTER